MHPNISGLDVPNNLSKVKTLKASSVAEVKPVPRNESHFPWHGCGFVPHRHRAGRLSPPGPLRDAALLLCVSALALAGCNRAPSEPPSAHADPLPTVASATATAASKRCVVPLAATPGAVPSAAGPRCPPDPLKHPPALARKTVGVPEAGVSVNAELATTPEQTERGLMFRTKMAEEDGMFFSLEDRKEQVFWMHNTCIPLDMLFIDEDATIVGVVENAPVLDDDPRSVSCPSRFVLEVNAGWVRRHNVKPGQKVALPSL